MMVFDSFNSSILLSTAVLRSRFCRTSAKIRTRLIWVPVSIVAIATKVRIDSMMTMVSVGYGTMTWRIMFITDIKCRIFF